MPPSRWSPAISAGVDQGMRGVSVGIERLKVAYGPVTAVNDVSLDIAPGEFLALLGPSGSGKTTILMTLAGFEHPSAGRILIGSDDVTTRPTNQRNIGMVFQRYSLFPHMSVRDNVAFPLKMRGVAKAERARLAEAALAKVRLAEFAGRMPAQLSGGQQQRVALARAIVYEPRVLLMDEPLSALDKNLREEMQLEILRLKEQLGITVVFVTHDQQEALTMADRVAVLSNGQLQQLGSPRDLYEAPANRFVAGFVGEMNFLEVGVLRSSGDGAAVRLPGGAEAVLPQGQIAGSPSGAQAVLAVRPERLVPVADGGVPVAVEQVVYSGATVLLVARSDDGTEIRARIGTHAGLAPLARGDRIRLGWAPEAARLFA